MTESRGKPDFTGTMRKGEARGSVVITLSDRWGWPIEVTGWLDKASGSYVLEGWLGATPEVLRVEGLDGEEEKRGARGKDGVVS